MLDPSDALEDLHNASVLYFRAKDYPKAFAAIERALELYPDRAELYNQLGSLQKHQEQFTQAEASFKKALALCPDLATTHHHLGLLYYQQYQYEKAERAYEEALKLAPDFMQAMHNLVLVYLAQQRKEAALSGLLGILSAYPQDLRAHFQIGKLLVEASRLEEANQHFAEAATAAGEDLSVLESILKVWMEHQAFAFAKIYAERVVALGPDSASAHYNLGVILEKLRQVDSAINAYRAALACDANCFEALNNLGVLYLEQELTDRARDCFERARVLHPENENIRYTLSALKGDAKVAASPQGYITQLFDHYAEHFDVHLQEGLQYQVPALLFALSRPYLPRLPLGKLLDLGCGTGLAAIPFKPYYEAAIGVDLSSKMLAKASEKNKYDQLVCGDILSFFSRTLEKFSLILAADVLVYQGQLEALFSEVSAHLVSGGLFAFSVELTDQMPYALQKSGRFAHAETYLLSLAREFGFVVLQGETAVTRVQNHRPVYGGLMLWKRC